MNRPENLRSNKGLGETSHFIIAEWAHELENLALEAAQVQRKCQNIVVIVILGMFFIIGLYYFSARQLTEVEIEGDQAFVFRDLGVFAGFFLYGCLFVGTLRIFTLYRRFKSLSRYLRDYMFGAEEIVFDLVNETQHTAIASYEERVGRRLLILRLEHALSEAKKIASIRSIAQFLVGNIA